MPAGQQSMSLEKALDMLFEALIENGLLPDKANKEELIDDVLLNLRNANHGNLPELNLKNQTTFKALGVAMLACFIKKYDPTFKFDFTLLFQNLNNMSDQEILEFKLELKQALEVLLLRLNGKPPRLSPAAIRKTAEELAEAMVEKNNNQLAADAFAVAFFSEAITLFMEFDPATLVLRSLYGGFDPRVEGGVGMTVTTIPGNTEGFIDWASGFGQSYMADQNKYDEINPAIFTNKINLGLPTLVSNTPTLHPGG